MADVKRMPVPASDSFEQNMSDNKMHYKGELGEFDYDPEQFRIQKMNAAQTDDFEGGSYEVLHYIGKETNGSKITIPEGIKDISEMFRGTNVVSMPKIPAGVEYANAAFMDCNKLEDSSEYPLPDTLKQTAHMFANCKNLRNGVKELPSSVEDAPCMYLDCEKLLHPTKLNEGTKDASYMYTGCANMREKPNIPKSLVSADDMTYGCTTLDEQRQTAHDKQYRSTRKAVEKSFDIPHNIRKKTGAILSSFMQCHALRSQGFGFMEAAGQVYAMRKNGQLGTGFSDGLTYMANLSGSHGMLAMMARGSRWVSNKLESGYESRRSAALSHVDKVNTNGLINGNMDRRMSANAQNMVKKNQFVRFEEASYSEKANERERWSQVAKLRERTLEEGMANKTLTVNKKTDIGNWYLQQLSSYATYYQTAKTAIDEKYKDDPTQKKQAMSGLYQINQMQMAPMMDSITRNQEKYGFLNEKQRQQMNRILEQMPQAAGSRSRLKTVEKDVKNPTPTKDTYTAEPKSEKPLRSGVSRSVSVSGEPPKAKTTYSRKRTGVAAVQEYADQEEAAESSPEYEV